MNPCPKCGATVNVLGRSSDGRLHPGKACDERLANINEMNRLIKLPFATRSAVSMRNFAESRKEI